MALSRRSTRPRFVLLLLILTAITLITLDQRSGGHGMLDRVRGSVRDAYTPVGRSVRDALSPVGDYLHGVIHNGDLKAENARLRAQLAAARIAQLNALNAVRENQALRDQLHLDFVGDIPTVAAQVLGTTSSNFELTIQIDRGTNSGVGVGMPVVASGGLVGRVVEASARQATVLLVTDPTSHIGVRFPNTDTGVATGTGPSAPLRVEFVDPKTVLKLGSVLSTSGQQGGLFPAGIPVGTVRTASTPPGALQANVTLSPVVDVSKLEFVQVLQWATR